MKKLKLTIAGLGILLSLQAQTKIAATVNTSNITDWTIHVPKAHDGDYNDNATHSLIVNTPATSKYFVLDLVKDYSINKIKVFFGAAKPYSYSIYNTSDGSTSPIFICSAGCNTIEITSFSFPGNINKTRFLRVVLNGYNGTVNFSLTEFEVYGSPVIYYSYDDAGNRTKREPKGLLLKSGFIPDSLNSEMALNDSLQKEKEKYTDELTGHTINMFPNPTKGQINVAVTNLKENEVVSVRVVDMSGKQLLDIKNLQNGIVDLHNQPNGIYLMRISINGETTEWKVIKE
jgi:hypothetical protein